MGSARTCWRSLTALISAAGDDVPDFTQPPIPPEIASGNYVAIDLGSGRYAFYEHLQRGSILVKAGDRVTRGQVIARLGASGSSSIGPHLHFHVSDANSPLEAEGLPFVFDRFDHLGGFESIDALVNGAKWSAAPAGSLPSRSRERPEPNAVRQIPLSYRFFGGATCFDTHRHQPGRPQFFMQRRDIARRERIELPDLGRELRGDLIERPHLRVGRRGRRCLKLPSQIENAEPGAAPSALELLFQVVQLLRELLDLGRDLAGHVRCGS